MKPFLPVLVYQKIGKPFKNSHLKNLWTSVRHLEKQLSRLVAKGYTFITPEDLSNQLPAKPILLVFMGGYESIYAEVFPLLQKYSARATVCVAQETVGTYNSWQDPYQEPWQNIITEKQLKEMVKSGLVSVGTLGLSGENLLNLPPADARNALEESIYRFKTIHKLKVCAVGFWPGVKDKNLARTHEICAGLNLPVFTSVYGKNLPEEKQFLRVLRPGVWAQLLLACR